MRAVTITLLGALTLVAGAIGLTLASAPASVARSNRTPGKPDVPLASATHSARYCQAGEVLPHGTSAIRVWIDAATGPRTTVTVASGGRPLLSATRGSGWIGGSVTVAVRPLRRTLSNATVCVSFQLRDETAVLQGETTPAAIAARDTGGLALNGRFWIEYLRTGRRSWASLASSVVDHMGLGRAIPGPGIVYLALALLVAVCALASGLVLKELP